MHPLLLRRREAQERARHLLDVHFGPLDVTAPEAATPAERERLELAARESARNLLDDEMRAWLEHLEQCQQADVFDALAAAAPAAAEHLAPPPADDMDEPASATALHQLVTIAHALHTAQLTPHPA